jgi:hypothetical protein
MSSPTPSPTDNLADVPTAEQYKEAFLESRPAMKGKKYLDMLRANYRADDHTVTAAELANAVDFETFSAANLRYGTYAKVLCKALNRTPKYPIAILVTFSPGEQPGAEFVRWTMLPQVTAALEDLGWVGRV